MCARPGKPLSITVTVIIVWFARGDSARHLFTYFSAVAGAIAGDYPFFASPLV